MKENILYYYHIDVDNIKEYQDYCCIKVDDETYIFQKLYRSELQFKQLLSVLDELDKKQIDFYPLVLNAYNSFITEIDNNQYVLIKTYDLLKEYDILDIIKFQDLIRIRYHKKYPSWGNLWSEKVDYLSYQVHELGKSYPLIVNSFSYFVALAENAIMYANKVVGEPNSLVLSHRRVSYPYYKLNFSNPLGFIFDLDVRDIGEYLKCTFFSDKSLALEDLKTYINLKRPSQYSLLMLYARLLYPSYYFDLQERIIEKKESEDLLIPVIDKIEEYEEFLKDCYEIINSYLPIEPVLWLLNKEL